jgi:hypothetical protein
MSDYTPRAIAEGFDYQAEADKTCSIEYHPEHVHTKVFVNHLNSIQQSADVLNVVKKLLFRGKTPDQLRVLWPGEGEGFDALGLDPSYVDLIHGILGALTEAGELAEILLTLIATGKADRVNAVEECGDVRWYLNRVLRWANVTDEQCERANIAKLHGRGFAEGFSVQADSNRDLGNERSILAAGVDAPKLPLPPGGERKGPIGDCEGMDC